MTNIAGNQANHRQQEIIDLLQISGGSSRITTIAQDLDVSEETVRRNLKRLADDGLVAKTHGGVRLLTTETDGDFHERLSVNPNAKKLIAKHVAGMISNGSSLFLDVGSTTAYIAEALKSHKDLLVVTNSISVAVKLTTRNNNRVFMAGGELRNHDGGTFGSHAMDFVGNFKTDYAILSSAGINATDGFMLFDLEEAQFSRMIMSKASTRIIAADASKFHRKAPITIGDPSLVDYLITDAPLPEDIQIAAQLWDTEVRIAS